MDLLLGLDVGTTATKALLIDIKGKTVASSSYTYGLITPYKNWVEQDPEELWKGVTTTIHKVLENLKPEDRVLALSLSTQGGTTIPVDVDYKPVSNAISWMDHRAYKQAEQIRESFGESKMYEVTGWDIYDGLPLLHIVWLRQKASEIFRLTKYFLFVNDYIIQRLTGKICMDPSNAGITQLFNIATGQWDKNMLNVAEITPDQLSPMQKSGFVVGNVTAEASKETGLSESAVVVNGAHDQYCAAIGSGVIEPGDVMLSCGTAWVILGVMDQLRLDPKRRLSISPHIVPNRWGALRSMGAVGACMEWFLDNIWNQKDRRIQYDEINECADRVPAGSRGLIFYPSSGGYGHGARGGFIGLSIEHSRDDMVRAVMEGIAFDLRWTLEEVHESGIKSNVLRMVGGAASSSVWTKIVSDITQIPVVLPSITQSASYGAAILAGIGSGVFASHSEAYQSLSGQEKLIEPDEDNINIYDGLFHVYKDIFQQIRNSLTKLSDF